MRNGYALCSIAGLRAIEAYLNALSETETDVLRGLLRIGVQNDVEVTIGSLPGPLVSQAFCSALPVAYTRIVPDRWEAFAKLVLEAAYEATLLAAILNTRRGRSNIVLLTRLGGGAFGNDDNWITTAMRRALTKFLDHDLELRLVSFGPPPPSMLALEKSFS